MYCYVVKLPVFRLQRGSAKSPLAPSIPDLLGLTQVNIANRVHNPGIQSSNLGYGKSQL